MEDRSMKSSAANLWHFLGAERSPDCRRFAAAVAETMGGSISLGDVDQRGSLGEPIVLSLQIEWVMHRHPT